MIGGANIPMVSTELWPDGLPVLEQHLASEINEFVQSSYIFPIRTSNDNVTTFNAYKWNLHEEGCLRRLSTCDYWDKSL